MGDVADILNIEPKAPPLAEPSRALRLQSLPKEVIDLIGTKGGELPPSVPASGYAKEDPNKKKASLIKVGNKFIDAGKPARKWVWAPFSSSARTDGLLLHHWVRGNVEYPDYPYARFDIHLDPVTYANDDEYHRLLEDPNWSKSETDLLLHLAKQFELRWPIIHDRWIGSMATKTRRIEDLQHRYYSVAAIILRSRISHEAASEAQALAQQLSTATAAAAATTTTTDPITVENKEEKKRAMDALLIETAAARALAASDLSHQPIIHNLGTGSSNKVAFDLEAERERRNDMEALWNRTKEEEEEEAELRKELKQIEAQLRKLKKSGVHILAAAGGVGVMGKASTGIASSSVAAAAAATSSTASSRNVSRATTPLPPLAMTSDPAAISTMVAEALNTTAPVPIAGTPYLQSARLAPLTVGGPSGINKSLRSRMDAVLEELNISKIPIATKRACDLYDSVQKDVLTLLILQKTALEKEGLLASKRLKLAKQGGNVRVVDEETLLGITPPPKQPASSSAGTAAQNRSTSKAARTASSKGPKTSTASAAKTKSTTEKSADKADKSDAAGTATSKKLAPAGAVVGGKQAPGGKQAKKATTSSSAKRKRKATESSAKDPTVAGPNDATTAPPTSNIPVATAPITGQIATAPQIATATAPASVEKVAPAAKKKSKKAAPKDP